MWTMPQIGLQQVLQNGILDLKQNPAPLNNIFAYVNEPYLVNDYGPKYLDGIKAWFAQTKIPVVHAWHFNAERIPCISIHLASESEDESKAAMGDIWGVDDSGMTGVTNFNVQLDIGVHASKTSDQVLWLYYITSYILFKKKPIISMMGMQLSTFTASDWDRSDKYTVENIWTRWLRFRAVSNNYWEMQASEYAESLDLNIQTESNIDEE